MSDPHSRDLISSGVRKLREGLDRAWNLREKNGALRSRESLRVYHGDTEGAAGVPLIAVEKFGEHFWVYEWESDGVPPLANEGVDALQDWLRGRGARSAVFLRRPRRGIPAENAEVLLGTPPDSLVVQESREEGSPGYEIHFQRTRHPGLFLDHYPLRAWLRENSRGKSVLNTFAYTGSLSVCAGVGGASGVTTLDLSRPTTEWAKRNWELNAISGIADFIYGDVFEWLPKLRKRARVFDRIILDPPSFSRTKSGSFSTAQDLVKLHGLALDLLAPGGMLISSINSEKILPAAFQGAVREAAQKAGRALRSVVELRACPETFPRATHLKGGIYEEV